MKRLVVREWGDIYSLRYGLFRSPNIRENGKMYDITVLLKPVSASGLFYLQVIQAKQPSFWQFSSAWATYMPSHGRLAVWPLETGLLSFLVFLPPRVVEWVLTSASVSTLRTQVPFLCCLNFSSTKAQFFNHYHI